MKMRGSFFICVVMVVFACGIWFFPRIDRTSNFGKAPSGFRFAEVTAVKVRWISGRIVRYSEIAIADGQPQNATKYIHKQRFDDINICKQKDFEATKIIWSSGSDKVDFIFPQRIVSVIIGADGKTQVTSAPNSSTPTNSPPSTDKKAE